MKVRVTAIAVLVTALAVVAIASLTRAGAGPTVTIPAGLATRMTAAEVIELVSTRFAAANPKIVSVTATGATGLNAVEPDAGVDLSPDAAQVIWVVRATGTFVAPHQGPGGGKPITAASAYMLIDDATGMSIGMGMP